MISEYKQVFLEEVEQKGDSDQVVLTLDVQLKIQEAQDQGQP